MLIGREYRKFTSKLFAYAAYRWVAIWLIIAACASKGPLGIAAGLVVAAADLISEGNFQFTAYALNEQSRKDWMDRLTNRLFYKLLIEQIRAGNGTSIDVDELFSLAAKEAVADIKRAGDDAHSESTAWSWFSGIISFLWRCLSFVLYYGSALYLGSGGSF